MLLAIAVVPSLAVPDRARAQTAEDPAPQTDADFTPLATWEYVATPILLSSLLVRVVAQPDGSEWTWDETGPGDREVRDALRLRPKPLRRAMIRAGDYAFASSLVLPVVDVAAIWLALDRGPLARDLFFVSLEAFSATAALFFATQLLFPRERPFVRACREDPTYDTDCPSFHRWTSFPSGHLAIAMAAAGTTCLHHLNHDLYGPGWDQAACGGMIAIAMFTGISRIMGDAHWFSDTIIGLLFGAAGGILLPAALHYGAFDG